MNVPDLAPGVPSRVVTIDQVDFAEDAPTAGSIRFTLSWDLRHPPSGVTISAGSRTENLVSGRAEIRLFTDSPDIEDDRTGRHGPTWAIWVKKSWLPESYPIRVPPGTGPISLAAIPVFDWRNQ